MKQPLESKCKSSYLCKLAIPVKSFTIYKPQYVYKAQQKSSHSKYFIHNKNSMKKINLA